MRCCSEYTADGFTIAFEQLIAELDPALVLFPHTYQVRDFAPRLAARFGQTLIADVIGMRIEDGRPVFVRQLLQGKLNADYRHSRRRTVLRFGPGGRFPRGHDASRGRLRGRRLHAPARGVADPQPAGRALSGIGSRPWIWLRRQLIVSVGRGIKEKENMPIVEELATALGAELAASRPICDNGWLPMERQVGSSGQTVSPKVYIAVGISGAIQHLVGMKGSKAVVAINKDENAPIFEVADYGIVGDLFEVVPALTAAVRKAKGA